MKKNLYLSSVACDQRFKRLFEDDPLQNCRNCLGILESSRGPALKGSEGREFDTPVLSYCSRCVTSMTF